MVCCTGHFEIATFFRVFGTVAFSWLSLITRVVRAIGGHQKEPELCSSCLHALVNGRCLSFGLREYFVLLCDSRVTKSPCLYLLWPPPCTYIEPVIVARACINHLWHRLLGAVGHTNPPEYAFICAAVDTAVLFEWSRTLGPDTGAQLPHPLYS